MAMVGFDDFELADLLRVTVVAQDPAELGRQAAELLFQRMDGDSAPVAPYRHPDPPRAARIRRAESLRALAVRVSYLTSSPATA